MLYKQYHHDKCHHNYLSYKSSLTYNLFDNQSKVIAIELLKPSQ